MGTSPTHTKRHGCLAGGVFALVAASAAFVAFMGALLLGVVPVACGAPLEELQPLYFAGALVTSILIAGVAARFTYRWLRARHERRVS